MRNRLKGAVRLPDHTWIRGRGLSRAMPHGRVPDFGLYLGTAQLRARHEPELTWQHGWVPWHDFGLPLSHWVAARCITDLHDRSRSGQAVEVACEGGIGRTGTAIACMATLAGMGASEAIAWVREYYHRDAIETPAQQDWVTWFAARGRR